VIGVTAEDMYVRFRSDWRFAFGVIQGNVGVISTGRMGSSFDWFDHAVERRRLRKMVTRYIGFLLYGLPESADRSSVLYQPLLSLGDLDAMGEDYR
jgi:predicted Zn-dependent protease